MCWLMRFGSPGPSFKFTRRPMRFGIFWALFRIYALVDEVLVSSGFPLGANVCVCVYMTIDSPLVLALDTMPAVIGMQL